MEDQEAMVVIVVDMAHHHMSMAHRRLMEELGQAAISTINRPTPKAQQQQGAPTYKQTSYKPQYAKQTYSQTQVHNNMHKQTEERARTTSQPLHLINIRKRLSTKLSTSTNNQEEVDGD